MLVAIGVFKLFKASLLVAVAVGALKFVDPGTAEALRHWARASQVVASHALVRKLLAHLLDADQATLARISAVSLVYAALFVSEGVGLCLRKTWAEYLTAVMTISLLPFEAYDLWRGVSWPKLAVTAINAAVAAYLIWILRRSRSGWKA